jgi:hypothetical protein
VGGQHRKAQASHASSVLFDNSEFYGISDDEDSVDDGGLAGDRTGYVSDDPSAVSEEEGAEGLLSPRTHNVKHAPALPVPVAEDAVEALRPIDSDGDDAGPHHDDVEVVDEEEGVVRVGVVEDGGPSHGPNLADTVDALVRACVLLLPLLRVLMLLPLLDPDTASGGGPCGLDAMVCVRVGGMRRPWSLLLLLPLHELLLFLCSPPSHHPMTATGTRPRW